MLGREGFVKATFIAWLLLGSVWAQDKSNLSAREVFYVPKSATVARARPAARPAPRPVPNAPGESPAEPAAPAQAPVTVQKAEYYLATRTAVQIDEGASDCNASKAPADRKWRNVSEATTFHSGDRLRIVVQSNVSGYLYVFAQQSSGAFVDLIPRGRELAEIEAYEDTALPAICVQGPKGENVLWFLVTRDPKRAVDFKRLLRLSAPEPQEPARASGPLLASRDIVLEEAPGDEKEAPHSVYRKSSSDAGEQVFSIKIRQE